MAGERILYVCFDPALLILRERLLMAEGYEVDTVLGQDGVMAVKQIRDVDFVLVGDEGSLLERQRSVYRLKEEFFSPPIIALRRPSERLSDVDYQITTKDPKGWCEALADCIRRCRRLA